VKLTGNMIKKKEGIYFQFFVVLNISPVSFTELLPLQILYIFVSPLSAVGHNKSILVVGSFHHTSRSIHLTSFTISNRLIQGIYFLFDVLSFLAHSCIFVSPFAEDQPQMK
jgi:hypothetical protein